MQQKYWMWFSSPC